MDSRCSVNVTDNTCISVTGKVFTWKGGSRRKRTGQIQDCPKRISSLNLHIYISDTITVSSSINNLCPWLIVFFFFFFLNFGLFVWFAAQMKVMFVESENRNMITSLVVEQCQQHHVGPEIKCFKWGLSQPQKNNCNVRWPETYLAASWRKKKKKKRRGY